MHIQRLMMTPHIAMHHVDGLWRHLLLPPMATDEHDAYVGALNDQPFLFVESVSETRARRVAARSEPPNLGISGEFLVYFPDDNLRDYAACAESEGFFDDDNIPAWETWVAYFHDTDSPRFSDHYLLAWVPEPFVFLANEGISVNPEACIEWLEDADVGARYIGLI